MRTKPKKLDYLALFLMGMALAMPLQIMILYGHTPFEVEGVFTKLAPLNWMVMVLAPLTAWLIYRASPLVIVAAPVLTTVVLHNNWLVAEVGTDYSPVMVGFGSGGFLVLMASLLTRDMRDLLTNPGRRWWLTPKRKRAEIPVHIVVPGVGEYSFDSRTFDISESGAFIVPLNRPGTRDSGFLPALNRIESGTNCSVSIDLWGADRRKKAAPPIQCRAEIVRAVEAHGQYPSGLGIRFVGLGRDQRKILQTFVEAA